MKRGFEQEDLSELLEFLDDEAEGPSHDGDNDREPEFEPKHKIFLSHSGIQKNFTEQLCLDLERWQYYPFFDKRPESLPKGKKFPELIFQAAQQCRVAVLILSEEFFTKTKWPMLELEAFVQSTQNKSPQKIAILPVYLELSRDECTKNETRRLHWLSVWQKWAEDDDRIDVDKWERALKVLEPSNGIEYVQSLGEVALREQIVSAVRRLVPPENTWSAAHVQARTRIYKAIIEKFARTKPSPLYGVRVVGIHGMGGIGKTTFCKVLCDELYMKFQGKVCHGELGIRSAIELQKQVLRELTDTNPDSLTFSTEDMTTNLLRRRIRRQQVFLALDNVWQQSVEEAKVYLRAGFHHGSIVIVTARSIDILSRLNIDKGDCLEMPELNEEDAKWLFLHHAAPGLQFITEDDEQKIQYCVRQCQFHKGANMGEHFHPLALKVLGAQLGSLECDPSIWVENLAKDDKFNQFREREHPLFGILRRGYDSLCDEDQILFMDGILFYPSRRYYESVLISTYFVTAGERHIFRLDLFEWLSIVHKCEVRVIKDRLQGLKAKSLLEDIGDGFNGVTVHDLYFEFAKLEVKRGSLDARRCMWYHEEVDYPTDLARMPAGNCWPLLERVSVKYDENPLEERVRWMGTIEGIKWQHFSNVVVLHLKVSRNEVLDLRGLQSLRSLEVKWGGTKHYGGAAKLIGVGEMRNLGWLELENIHYAPCFEEIGHCTTLEVLRLNTSCSEVNCEEGSLSQPLELLNLDKCIQLRELVLRCPCLKAFPDLSRLTSLRLVLFEACDSAREVVGLGSQMSSLQELLLLRCKSLCRCPGLSDLVSLQELDVEHCRELGERLPDLHKLTNLRRLNITWSKVNRLLGFNDSMLLEELDVSGVQELPDLHLLSRRLQRLSIRSYTVQEMLLRFGRFTALEELILDNLPEVRELPGMHKLTRLRRLTVGGAPKLFQLPAIGDLVALQYLSLTACCSVEIPKLPDLHYLTNLEVLILRGTPIRSLPGLECLTQLRELNCVATLLAELPDLSGLKTLEYIDLSRCHQLTSLDNVGTMTAVIFLNVFTCYKLERLPDLRSSKSLEYLGLCYTGVRLLPEDIMTLATLPVLRMFAWDHFEVSFSKLLEKVSLAEVLAQIEAKQSEFFATSESMVWTEPDALLGRGNYRHVSHACMHNSFLWRI